MFCYFYNKKSISDDRCHFIACRKLKREQATIDFNVRRRKPGAIHNLQEVTVNEEMNDPFPSVLSLSLSFPSHHYQHSSNDKMK